MERGVGEAKKDALKGKERRGASDVAWGRAASMDSPIKRGERLIEAHRYRRRNGKAYGKHLENTASHAHDFGECRSIETKVYEGTHTHTPKKNKCAERWHALCERCSRVMH